MEKRYKGPFRRDKKKDDRREEVKVVQDLTELEDMRLNRYLAHSGVSSRRKADDIIKLAKVAKQRVFEKFGIELKAEVQLIGLDLN
jgi:endonuclease III